jgi:2-iminobutanoate/2-iminopropanoate deaminase
MPNESKLVVETQEAPDAIGPYSQAVGFNGLLFLSGQIGLDPETGEMAEGGVVPQITQVMANLSAVLDAAGLNFSHVIRTTIYLADMDHYEKVNDIYGEFFDTNPPARAAVAVKELPAEAEVEVSMIAARPQADDEA